MKKFAFFGIALAAFAIIGSSVSANYLSSYYTYRAKYERGLSQTRVLRAGLVSDQNQVKMLGPNTRVISELKEGEQVQFVIDPKFSESKNLVMLKWHYNSKGLACEEISTDNLRCTVLAGDTISDVWVEFTVREYVLNWSYRLATYKSNVINVTKDWVVQ